MCIVIAQKHNYDNIYVPSSGKHNLIDNFKIQEKLGSYWLHCHFIT